MEKRQLNFLRHLARAPKDQVVPTLKAASDADWKCLNKLCNSAIKGELPTVVLPKASKRWFSGVARGIHKTPKAFKRSALQRGGSTAQMLGTTFKTLAKAAVPLMKTLGKQLAQKAATSAIEAGSDKILEKMTKKKTVPINPPEPEDDDSDDDKPSADELLQMKF